MGHGRSCLSPRLIGRGGSGNPWLWRRLKRLGSEWKQRNNRREFHPLGSSGDRSHSELPSEHLHFSCSRERIFELGQCRSLRTSFGCDRDAEHFYVDSGNICATEGGCGSICGGCQRRVLTNSNDRDRRRRASGTGQPGRDRDIRLAIAIDDHEHQPSGFCLIGVQPDRGARGRGNGPGERLRYPIRRFQRADRSYACRVACRRNCLSIHSYVDARYAADRYVERGG